MSTVIIALFILFAANGDVATGAQTVSINMADCRSRAEMITQSYMDEHKGDTLIALCLPINKQGVDYAPYQ